MLELTADELSVVQHALARRLPQAKVTAFGSRVRGWPFGRGCKPFSDLDLAIESQQAIPDLMLAELRADFDDSPLPWRVDLSLFGDLPEDLQELVRVHGVAICGELTPRGSIFGDCH